MEYIACDGIPSNSVPSPEWEVPDEGMRFLDDDYATELCKGLQHRLDGGSA